jgi:hypothetical protein
MTVAFMGAPLKAQDRYYAIVFGAETKPKQPKYSHTWAVFVRADCNDTIIESHVISWLPCVVVLHPNRPLPEPGRNFDLHTTFQAALEQCENVGQWGPFPICPELYEKALWQIDRLNSGEVQYKTVDFWFNVGRVCNCIHACLYVVDERRELRVPEFNFGKPAAYGVAQVYWKKYGDCWGPCPPPRVLESQLGLTAYRIRRYALDEKPRRHDE